VISDECLVARGEQERDAASPETLATQPVSTRDRTCCENSRGLGVVQNAPRASIRSTYNADFLSDDKQLNKDEP
jgi:hypothetical protein